MGHVRLGSLPKTRKWQQVIDLLGSDADVVEIAAASSDAAENSLAQAAKDPAFLHSFWLLTQIPLAARTENFAAELRQLGLNVGSDPSLMEVLSAFGDAVDRHARETGAGQRTDFGEMARMAATEALGTVAGRDLPGLFGPTADDVKLSIGKLTSPNNFSILSRDFFSRLTQRHLDYYLSRELSKHVGPQGRFNSIAEHTEFNAALESHCKEASRIIKEFAGGWYSKKNYENELTPSEAGKFAHVAFKKIRNELRKRRDADG